MSDMQTRSLRHNIQMKFSSTLTWRRGGTVYTDICGQPHSGLEIDRQMDAIPDGYCIRMTVRNTSSDVIYIQNMELFRIAQEEDLTFGDEPLWVQSGENWQDLILNWAHAKADYFGVSDSRRPTPHRATCRSNFTAGKTTSPPRRNAPPVRDPDTQRRFSPYPRL